MYDLFYNFISHIWDIEAVGNDQTIITGACCALVLLFFVWILDSITAFLMNIHKK